MRDPRTPKTKNALPYHGSGAVVRFVKPAIFFGAISFACALAGCGTSVQLGSMMPDKYKTAYAGEKGDITGSIPKSASQDPTKALMSVADWSYAGAALREALKGREDNASVPWTNPNTGSGGTVTLVAATYTQDGFPCRNFLASNVREGKEAWFSGTACRLHKGEWDIRSTRPLQKS